MNKCEKCKHKSVCKHIDDMERLQQELADKNKLVEYSTFKIEIQCKNYFDEHTPVIFTKRKVG